MFGGLDEHPQPQLLDQFDHTQFQGSRVLTFQKRHWSLGIDEFQKDMTGTRILADPESL